MTAPPPPPAVDELLAAFDLGEGTLSPEPVARGRVGEIWRLDATGGTWAVKTEANEVSEAGAAPAARFQEAAVAAGVPAPEVRRSTDGCVFARAGGVPVRMLSWVDMEPADPLLDAAAVGAVVGRLHRTPVAGAWTATDVDPWFQDPVGAEGWDALVDGLRRHEAPFADGLAAHRDELVALESLLDPPTELRWCHHDLFADNVRAVPTGGLVVFDFDNSGPENASRELAMVVAEFATAAPNMGHTVVDAGRVRDLLAAYEAAGGPGRLTRPQDFGTVIAVLGHISHHAATRWLAATDDSVRADMTVWVHELLDRPLTRQVIADLLDAAQ